MKKQNKHPIGKSDVVPAMLSPGEGILTPEGLALLGGEKVLNELNAKGMELKKQGVPVNQIQPLNFEGMEGGMMDEAPPLGKPQGFALGGVVDNTQQQIRNDVMYPSLTMGMGQDERGIANSILGHGLGFESGGKVDASLVSRLPGSQQNSAAQATQMRSTMQPQGKVGYAQSQPQFTPDQLLQQQMERSAAMKPQGMNLKPRLAMASTFTPAVADSQTVGNVANNFANNASDPALRAKLQMMFPPQTGAPVPGSITDRAMQSIPPLGFCKGGKVQGYATGGVAEEYPLRNLIEKNTGLTNRFQSSMPLPADKATKVQQALVQGKAGAMNLLKGLTGEGSIVTQAANQVLNNPMVAQQRDDALKAAISKIRPNQEQQPSLGLNKQINTSPSAINSAPDLLKTSSVPVPQQQTPAQPTPGKQQPLNYQGDITTNGITQPYFDNNPVSHTTDKNIYGQESNNPPPLGIPSRQDWAEQLYRETERAKQLKNANMLYDEGHNYLGQANLPPRDNTDAENQFAQTRLALGGRELDQRENMAALDREANTATATEANRLAREKNAYDRYRNFTTKDYDQNGSIVGETPHILDQSTGTEVGAENNMQIFKARLQKSMAAINDPNADESIKSLARQFLEQNGLIIKK